MKHMIPLSRVRVASPCDADWDLMKGDDRARFCSQCQMNVFNLSAMSKEEAEALIHEKNGKLCVRYYQRRDGTVISADCPVGKSAVIRRMKSVAAAAVMTLVSGIAYAGTFGREEQFESAKQRILHTQPLKTVVDLISPPRAIAGDMVAVPSKP